MWNKLLGGLRQAAISVLLVLAALVVGGLLVTLTGNSPMEAYGAMLNGAFGSTQKLCELGVKFIPITMIAFGISIAFRAQLWNIGAGGQFIMGSIAATVVALYVPVPFILRSILSLIAAMAAGGAWAMLAGWLKVKFNANEVITTLMLTYVAEYFLAYLVYGPMMDPSGELAQSELVPEVMKLPKLIGTYRLHAGIFIMLAVIILMFFFWRTTLGYRIDLVGQGRKVATYAGLHVNRTILLTMCLSGALAGLAGWIETFGIQYRILEGIAGDYGDIGNVIALLGGLNPLGIVISSAFFAVLLVGGASMQRMTEVPYSIVEVIQGLIIVFVIARAVFQIKGNKLTKTRKKSAKKEGTGNAS